MDKQALKITLQSNFPHQLTDDQDKTIDALARFFTTKVENPAMILKGYAGTGKTTMVRAIVKTLPDINQKFVLLAPTGRAAKVMMNYTGSFASTIHRKIYYTEQGAAGIEAFSLSKNKHTNTTFIVDEASMIAGDSFDFFYGSNNLLEDLLSYVYSGDNCNVIFIGDSAQLPPVGTTLSPALNKNYLQSSYHLNIGTVELTEVVRQNLDSGILFNATEIRKQILSKSNAFPNISTDFDDISAITGVELEEELESAYGKYGQDETIIICRSNKRANLFNQQIRARIKWCEDQLNAGDRLMVVKNNYFWLDNTSKAGFIANGDILVISTVRSIEEKYGYQFANVVVEFCDYENEPPMELKVLMDTIHLEAPSLNMQESKELYYAIMEEEYMHIHSKKGRHQKVMKDPYYNALQIKFAYAVTCHKSQGGQWDCAFVDQGFLTEDMINEEYLRWLYTAVTRAKKKLYFVNFNERFFET